jgi:hypothetical protein
MRPVPRRRVKRTAKAHGGDIARLCGDWGTVRKGMAIAEIEAGINQYYVAESGTPVEVIVFVSKRRRRQFTPVFRRAWNVELVAERPKAGPSAVQSAFATFRSSASTTSPHRMRVGHVFSG